MMKDHIFLCMSALNQATVGGSMLLEFQTFKEAEQHIRDWLERSCGLECYRAEEEEKVRAEIQGDLADFLFFCPEVENPSDLKKYNGFYYHASGGSFHLFVMPIYDEQSAAQFRKEVTKEYELDKTFSEEADTILEMLETLERSFKEEVDYTEALHQVDTLLRNEGLSFF